MSDPSAHDDRPTPATTLAAVQAELAAWRRTHPTATFAELEAAVEAGVAPLRARLLAEALPADPGPSEREATRPQCGTCAVPLVRRGQHRRTVQIWGDHTVELARTYWSCPRCGAGHFPPG